MEATRPKKPVNSVFDQPSNKWQPNNPYDRFEENEVLTYKDYRLRQIYQMKKMQEEHEMQGNDALSHDGQPSLFSQLNIAKRVAWYKIYNDYLQSRWTKDTNRRDIGGQRNRGSQSQVELPSEHELLEAQSQREFLELFRDWEKVAESSSVLEWLKSGEAGRTTSVLPAVSGLPHSFLKEFADLTYNAIVSEENALQRRKEKMLLDTGAKSMADKDFLDKTDIEEYEKDLSQISELKASFAE